MIRPQSAHLSSRPCTNPSFAQTHQPKHLPGQGLQFNNTSLWERRPRRDRTPTGHGTSPRGRGSYQEAIKP
jgi:hypothetical protein